MFLREHFVGFSKEEGARGWLLSAGGLDCQLKQASSERAPAVHRPRRAPRSVPV